MLIFGSRASRGEGGGWVGIMVTNYSVWLQLQTQAGKPCLTFPTVPLWSVIIIMIGLISETLCAKAMAGWSQATVAEERRRAINWGGEDDGHESLQQQSINNMMVSSGGGVRRLACLKSPEPWQEKNKHETGFVPEKEAQKSSLILCHLQNVALC